MDYKDITVSQYYKILDVLKQSEDPLDIQVGLIDAIWGEDAAELTITDFKRKSDELSFLDKPYKAKKPKSSYLFGDTKYNILNDFSKVTTAQFIDAQTLLKRNNWKLLMNCLFIKDGERYGDSDNSEFLYNTVTLDVYLDVLESFSLCFRRLQVLTLNSSIKEMKRLLKQTKDRGERMILLKKIVEMKQAQKILMDDSR